MTINIKEKTIIFTIGITNCGKSYFCENVLIPFLKNEKATVKYLSSDKIRKELADDDTLHKHAPRGLQLSIQAFSILENLLDNYTQYPVNTDVVVVDAMNISKEGREFIYKIARKNNYKLVGLLFDYKDREDYYKYINDVDKRVITDRLKYFKENTLKDVKKSDFDDLYVINTNDFDQLNIGYESNIANRPNLDVYKKFCIVGDVHGCFDEFITAITDDKGIAYDHVTGKLSITDINKYHHHVLVGDLVDKGPKIKEVIKLVYDNLEFFTIVIGNHENFVYKFLKGELGSYEKNEELIKNWFDTIDLIKDDEDYKKMFNHIFKSSYEFVEHPQFIVTHAPCDVKYLGKFDAKSAKAQRNFSYPKRVDFATEEEFIEKKEKALEFITEQAEFVHPFHFFGHISVRDTFKFKNKFNIDTGCVAGNKLTTAVFNVGQKIPFFKSYASKQPVKETLDLLFTLKKKDINFDALEYEDKKRLEWAANNKLNFVSGTMSPVDKDAQNNDLECLEKGIKYYQDAKVDKLIIQPKFMGSRGNLLLHKNNLEKTQLFSRQGFLVKPERLTGNYNLADLIRDLQFKYNDLFIKLDAEYILFDGELLPWSAMGKGLIDKDFKIPYEANNSELKLLKETGFFDKLSDAYNKFDNVADKSELKPHELSNMKAMFAFRNEMQTEEVIEKDINEYIQELNYFTAESQLEYKPFSILKVYKKDGTEENYISEKHSNIDIFTSISDEPYMIVDLNQFTYTCVINKEAVSSKDQEKNYEGLIQAIYVFWNYITSMQHMEGVVIKPEFTYKHGVAPYLKCRNRRYLKLIYGMDYESIEHKYKNLISTKNTKHKVATSIKEWVLAKKLLDIPRNQISIQNSEWVSLVYQLITEQEGEKSLDPRL